MTQKMRKIFIRINKNGCKYFNENRKQCQFLWTLYAAKHLMQGYTDFDLQKKRSRFREDYSTGVGCLHHFKTMQFCKKPYAMHITQNLMRYS